MSVELLGRRSHSPKSLNSSPVKVRSPVNLHFLSSFSTIEITNVEFQCQQSPFDNHTEYFSPRACEQALIVRRGNTIVLKITTSVQLSSTYVVSLTFVSYHRPRERFGQFRARGVARQSNELWLSISLPPNFPVGKYHTQLSLFLGGELATHFCGQAIAVLFNPWSKEDEAHLSKGIETYLMADVGEIARGTAEQKSTLKWEFGQYEDCVLDVALYLITPLSVEECRSPVGVARGIIARICTRDNTGVMMFGGGAIGATHPCRWGSSTAILQKYYRMKTPVRYGQCWVFAGVAVSLLRALGLAARPVTCYNAAHFTSHCGYVKRYFTSRGELMQDLSRDEIWLYHVWVESWMLRSDLSGTGYDGWQALDPTPHNKQSGCFRVGPVPVAAIREKKIFKKQSFGCEFLVSEVSSATKYFRTREGPTNRSHTLAHVCKDEVATAIVTMRTDKTGLLDISDTYREPHTHSHPHIAHFPPPCRDCSFEVGCEAVRLGEIITVVTILKNNGALQHTVDGRVVCHTVDYSGRTVRRFASMQFTGVVSPGQSASVSLPIPSKQYWPVLVEQAMMIFFIAIKVRETQQLFLKSVPYQLLLPRLEVDCPDSVRVGATLRVKLHFKNILPSSLSRVLFLLQAGRLCPQRELSSKRLVLPGGMISVECLLKVVCPPGNYTMTASMHCDRLTDVHGSKAVHVLETS